MTKMSAKQSNVNKWYRLNDLIWNCPFEAEGGTSAEKQKLVMLALAKFADGDGERCHPGQTRLAVMSGQSERSVRRCLKLFDDKGFVQSKRRWHTSSAYTINHQSLRQATTMAYLPIALILAGNGRLTPALSGHIERVLGPYDPYSEAISDLQSGHLDGLLTTSNDLPEVELPVDQPNYLTNSFAIATDGPKRDPFAKAQQTAKGSEPRNKEDCATLAFPHYEYPWVDDDPKDCDRDWINECFAIGFSAEEVKEQLPRASQNAKAQRADYIHQVVDECYTLRIAA